MSVLPGLVSVTFRQLTPAEIIALSVEHGMRAIEWGGDVHVPVGDLARAREVATQCADAGIGVEAYGSYYRTTGEFGPVLETAIALGATRVRVWAGERGSAEESDRGRVVRALRGVVGDAQRAGVEVAVEYHANTLTDSLVSATKLLGEVPGLRSYWQPPIGSTLGDALDAVPILQPVAAHVFSWDDVGRRLPLVSRERLWRAVIAELRALPGTRYALLEFVRDDDPLVFGVDAAVLRGWLAGPGWGDDT